MDDRFFVGVNPGNPFKIERNPGGEAPASQPPCNAAARHRPKAAQRAAQTPVINQPSLARFDV